MSIVRSASTAERLQRENPRGGMLLHKVVATICLDKADQKNADLLCE